MAKNSRVSSRIPYVSSRAPKERRGGGGSRREREYWAEVERNAQQSQGWQSGGSVNGEPAKTKEEGDRLRAIHGTPNLQKGDGHGEVVTNDGINASYVRDPGMDHSNYVIDDTKDEPYGPRKS